LRNYRSVDERWYKKNAIPERGIMGRRMAMLRFLPERDFQSRPAPRGDTSLDDADGLQISFTDTIIGRRRKTLRR
jgi:hypothetical protein